MKHKTWFRLVLKAIGVLLVGLSLPDVFTTVLRVVYVTTDDQFSANLATPQWWTWGSFAAPLLQFAFGLYLFFGGGWVVIKAIPSNRPYCPDCGYPLNNLSGPERCPECGAALPRNPPAPQSS
jgi:hypothetical protein